MVNTDPKQVEALLNLLADEDDSIAHTAEEQLLDMGTEIIPELKQNLADQPLTVKLRVREIVHQLESDNLEEDFRNLPTKADGTPRLEDALFTIAKIGHPTLHPEPYRNQIDQIADDIKSELDRWESIDPHTIVETVSTVLFDEHGFKGNRDDYYNPGNSYLHQVIKERKGIPISLSSLILILAERLNLPFRGVGMPAHFILSFPTADDPIYLDPFNEGKLLSKNDCVQFLNRTGFGFVPEYLEPVDNKEIILRSLRNLAKIFSKKQMSDRIKQIRAYMAILDRTY